MKINYLLISLITLSTNVLPLSLKTFVFSPHASESENSNVTAIDDISVSATSTDASLLMKKIDEGYVINDYYYFLNLKSNYPTNIYGECGWVATVMYLTYLNTFYCPTIDDADVVRATGSGKDISSYTESPGVLDSHSQDSFYGSFVDKYRSTYTYPTMQYMPTSLGYSEQADLIRDYLTDFGYTEKTDFVVSETKSVLNISYVYNAIIDSLQAGQPVMASTPEHYFIVYGYVPDTKKLIVHNGWKSSTLMLFNDDGSEQDPGIQYIVTACFLKHVHNYLYVDSSSETAYCYCGDYVCTTPYYHKHVMEAVRQGSKIRFKCSICGYIKE